FAFNEYCRLGGNSAVKAPDFQSTGYTFEPRSIYFVCCGRLLQAFKQNVVRSQV
ncbi:unnamed protein product, partial [Schistosoma curassoni]|uniref:PARP catalytic domain-containing protein n=1 Tax=Schistosoma curassoni TaxID=6186 RepID=A0A183KEN6_9TREM